MKDFLLNCKMKSIKDKLISQLNLTPHPEGGFYREIYRLDHAEIIMKLIKNR